MKVGFNTISAQSAMRVIFADDDFFWNICIAFNSPLRHLNMQWSYQLILNHFQFLYTDWKPFVFSSPYLLEVDQAQLKSSNYDVLLSAWLVSMEICPNGVFFLSGIYLFKLKSTMKFILFYLFFLWCSQLQNKYCLQ